MVPSCSLPGGPLLAGLGPSSSAHQPGHQLPEVSGAAAAATTARVPLERPGSQFVFGSVAVPGTPEAPALPAVPGSPAFPFEPVPEPP
jgi:hypothetical protein